MSNPGSGKNTSYNGTSAQDLMESQMAKMTVQKPSRDRPQSPKGPVITVTDPYAFKTKVVKPPE